MTKRISRSALARELIKQGVKPTDVARRTGLSKQTIYTIKWKMANKQGLGAIKPNTPAVGQGTGIAASAIPLEFEIIDRPKKSNNRRKGQLKRWARERQAREAREAMEGKLRSLGRPAPVNYGHFYQDVKITRPSLWQRVKAFFVGA